MVVSATNLIIVPRGIPYKLKVSDTYKFDCGYLGSQILLLDVPPYYEWYLFLATTIPYKNPFLSVSPPKNSSIRRAG
jgi:hypothetical protein